MAKEWEMVFLLEASLSLHILKQALDYWNYFWWKSFACAASMCSSRCDEQQNLMANASKVEAYFLEAIK
jgi:hypothetical protein